MKKRLLLYLYGAVTCLCVLSSTSKDSTHKEPNRAFPSADQNLTREFDGIQGEMDSIVKYKEYNKLYAFEEKFSKISLHVPDSLQSRFRSLCMWYAFRLKSNLGDFNTALKYYLVAHQFAHDHYCLDELTWFIENEIVSIYTRLGDYEKSNYFSTVVIQSLTCNNQWERLSRFYTNIGINAASSGDTTTARQVYLKGLRIADSLQYNAGQFSNCLGLGKLLIESNRPEEAEFYLQRAKSVLPGIAEHEKKFQKDSDLKTAFALMRLKQKRFPESISLYREALIPLRQSSRNETLRDIAKIHNAIAGVYIRLDSLFAAQKEIEAGIRTLIPEFTSSHPELDTSQLFRENSFVELFRQKIELLRKRYHLTPDSSLLIKALQYVHLALYVNDKIKDEIIAEPSKLKAIKDNKDLVNHGIEIVYQLYSRQGRPEYLEEARRLFTKSKSILFNERIEKRVLAQQMDPADKKRLDSLERAMLSLYEKKYDENADYDKINHQLFEAQEQIKLTLSKYREINLPVLRPDDYIDYVQTDHSIYALARTGHQAKFAQLGSTDEFAGLLRRMNEYVSLKELSLDTTIQRELYRFLVEPVTQSEHERLVIIPDGQISLLPFEMLEDGKGQMMLEKTTISYQYQYEPYLLREENTSKTDLVLCLAPRYNLPAPVAHEASRGSLYALPFARSEADAIRKIMGKAAIVSDDGTKDKCLEGLRNARIFHFSGHAIVQKDVAFLALTEGADIKKQLTDGEIGLMSNSLDMVVLSACETGLGKWDYGEGIRSLGRSFLESGAETSVYSLWTVNDRSTSRIMSAFYTYLRKGVPKDLALRKAKLDFIREAQGASAHPYHWAAFIISGDLSPLKQDSRIWMLIPVGVVVLLMVWILISRRAKA